MSGRKPIDADFVRDVDVVVTLGSQAHVEPVPGTRFENWDTDEPSGIERMRLVRDDIATHVQRLAEQLNSPVPQTEKEIR